MEKLYRVCQSGGIRVHGTYDSWIGAFWKWFKLQIKPQENKTFFYIEKYYIGGENDDRNKNKN